MNLADLLRNSGTPLRIAAIALVGVALGLMTFAVAAGQTQATRLYERYVAHLDRQLRMLFRAPKGKQIALTQLAIIITIIAARIAFGLPYAPVIILLVALGPEVHLRRARQQRVQRLEDQIDGFVVALANAMKTVPSPAAALQATTLILPEPTKQEIEHVLKEVRVGSTLEEGLLAMSARVKSRWVDVAFSSVLIGLRVGGNLPAVLERTAAMIREINRLLGVVRTRTSQGRAQLWVLALFPVAVIVVFNFVQPGYFDPLRDSLVGQICIGISSMLWLASLLVGRKILTVDV